MSVLFLQLFFPECMISDSADVGKGMTSSELIQVTRLLRVSFKSLLSITFYLYATTTYFVHLFNYFLVIHQIVSFFKKKPPNSFFVVTQ